MKNKRKIEHLPYILIFPTVLFLVVLVMYPLIVDLKHSFYQGSLTQESTFVGLENYYNVLKNPETLILAKNTFIWVAGSVSLQLIVGMVVALLLNKPLKGIRIFQIIIIVLPWATPDIVAASVWKWMYNGEYGIINELLSSLGLISSYKAWLGSTDTALWSVIIANVWKGFPLSAMMYLAGLKAIPGSLYESANMDGANRLQQFIYITIPGLKNIIVIVFLLTIIWTTNYFPMTYIMTGGGPVNSSDIFVTNIYRHAFKFYDIGTATTLAMLVFLVTLLITLLYLKGTKLKEE